MTTTDPGEGPAPLRLGLVGYGKIARDQHRPAIAADPAFELVALADPVASDADLPVHRDMAAMLAAHPQIEAVVLCQPARFRHDAALAAIEAGRHVFLEKPPGITPDEVEGLAARAGAAGRTLFAAWHSREAAQVGPARDWLAGRAIRAVRIDWKEDVRVWHPGQRWIWEAGGFGVFDPGINALSILTAIVPGPLQVSAAELDVPGNCATPIAAHLRLSTAVGAPVEAVFDFRQTGPQCWDIRIETDGGTLVLSDGGQRLSIAGVEQAPPRETFDGEYPALYRRFADLVARGTSDVDLAPLRLVTDALRIGRVRTVEDFTDPANSPAG